jgi:hypothetical protein
MVNSAVLEVDAEATSCTVRNNQTALAIIPISSRTAKIANAHNGSLMGEVSRVGDVIYSLF